MLVDGWWELMMVGESWWWLVGVGGVGVILFYVSLQWIERFGGEYLDKVRRNGQADTQTCRQSISLHCISLNFFSGVY